MPVPHVDTAYGNTPKRFIKIFAIVATSALVIGSIATLAAKLATKETEVIPTAEKRLVDRLAQAQFNPDNDTRADFSAPILQDEPGIHGWSVAYKHRSIEDYEISISVTRYGSDVHTWVPEGHSLRKAKVQAPQSPEK